MRLSGPGIFGHHRRMRQPPLRAAAFALAALTSATFAPRPAHADDNSAVVEQLFAEGRRLMTAGKVSEACPKFLASYNLEHRVGTILSLADCYEKNGQLASAWARFIEARTLATRNSQPERADYAAQHAAALEPRRSMLTINADANIPGLVIQRDGNVVDPAIYGVAVPVDGGAHKISVTASGKKPVSDAVTLAPEADRKTYSLPPLVDAPAGVVAALPGTSAPVAATTAAPASGHLSTRGIAGIVVAGAGVVMAGVGIYFGAAALGKNSDSTPYCNVGGVANNCYGPGVGDRSSAVSDATVSSVLLGVGAAAVMRRGGRLADGAVREGDGDGRVRRAHAPPGRCVLSPRARLALIRAVLGLGLGAAGCAQIFGIDEANAVPAPTDAAGDARHAKDAGSDGTKPAHDAAATKDATKSDAPAHHDSGRDAATDSPTKIDAQCTTPGTSADSCGTTCTDCTATAPTNETAACNAGACSYSCQFTMCPVTGGTTTVCSDPKTDPLNCGACGQSCLGGACSNGACQPVVLASRGANTLLSLAVDSTNVYWTENEAHTGAGLAPSDVVSCAKGGCDGGTVLFTERSDAGPSQLMGIATSADASTLDGGPANLYVAGLGGLVLAVPTSGGTATTLATGPGFQGISWGSRTFRSAAATTATS